MAMQVSKTGGWWTGDGELFILELFHEAFKVLVDGEQNQTHYSFEGGGRAPTKTTLNQGVEKCIGTLKLLSR